MKSELKRQTKSVVFSPLLNDHSFKVQMKTLEAIRKSFCSKFIRHRKKGYG